MKKLEPGQEITAEIVAITNDCIFIDLNEKSEGVLDRAELNNDKGECTVKEGEKIKVFFLGDKGGEMRFTTKISGDKANATMLENAYKNGIPVDGFVEKKLKADMKLKSVQAVLSVLIHKWASVKKILQKNLSVKRSLLEFRNSKKTEKIFWFQIVRF